MKLVAIAMLAFAVGCGSVNQGALAEDAHAPDVPGDKGLVGDGLVSQDGGVDLEAVVEAGQADSTPGADGGTDVDAVVADANASDGLQAEASQPEVAAPDLITGTWSFNFIPNRGNGEMTLLLVGKTISGTYAARNLPNDGAGPGTITGSLNGGDISLAFGGTVVATATGKLSTTTTGRARILDSEGSAVIAGKTYAFMASWDSK